MSWVCPECETENVAGATACDGCGEPAPATSAKNPAPEEEDDRYRGFVVGAAESVEPVEGKDNLRVVKVNIGKEVVQVVTNAKNVTPGAKVVVACVGAMVGETQIKKANVGGVVSMGMLCDPPMLGWVGGGAGAAVILPPSFQPGSKPPSTRPRGDGF
jgi:tRNA-binding EMAP/Myf-like protein